MLTRGKSETRALTKGDAFLFIFVPPVYGLFEFPRHFLLRKKIDECRRELPTPWRGILVHTRNIRVHTSMPTCAYMLITRAGHTDNTRICLSVCMTFKLYIRYVRKANGDYRPHEVIVLITKLSLS